MNSLELAWKEVLNELDKGSEHWREVETFYKLNENEYMEIEARIWAETIEHANEGERLHTRVDMWYDIVAGASGIKLRWALGRYRLARKQLDMQRNQLRT